MELAPSPRSAARGGPDLRGGLLAWASMIRRRRALVVVRRHLIAGLALTILVTAVSILLGGERRAWWLAVPLALALVDAAVAASRRVSAEHVAQLLDRRLGLHDRLVTALGIEREQGSPLGLRALVATEARTSVQASFASVCLRTRRPGREWASLCGCVAVLAVLAVVPGIGSTRSSRGAAARASRTPSGASARARARSNASSAAARRELAAGTQGTQINRPPLAVTSNGPPTTTGSGFSPYGHGGVSFSAKQLASQGLAHPSLGTKALGAVAINEAGGSGSGAASSTAGASGGAGAGKATVGGTSSAAPTSRAGGSASGAGPLTPLSGRRSASALAGSGTGKGNAGAGAGGIGNAPPGGNGAGSAAGSTALRAGLVPVLGAGSSGLPLQAGYAPSSARQAAGGEGISQTPNGGGSGGRSAQAGGGGQTSVSSSLGLIPPTFNSTSALNQGVLSSYFGSANQLTPGNW
ncbi:MAG TPA: hypothetical protein VK655_05260 [Solirubrobacteraceae bacterium]|jgi:hypothetical protein|nr:hypothetical protein [Solirubrobacteraceae bacterium]